MIRALALFPLALLIAPQDDEGKEQVTRDIFGRVKTEKVTEQNTLEGMWQLLSLEIEGYPKDGLDARGFLHIGSGFVSFELQATYQPGEFDYETLDDGYQSFMAEYQLVGGDRMVCRNLIGSYIEEEDDDIYFEPGGMMREYRLERTDRFLTLKWKGSNRMTFGRRPASRSSFQDIYGKDKGKKDPRGLDIFGRQPRDEEEEKDGEDKR